MFPEQRNNIVCPLLSPGAYFLVSCWAKKNECTQRESSSQKKRKGFLENRASVNHSRADDALLQNLVKAGLTFYKEFLLGAEEDRCFLHDKTCESLLC